LIILASTSVPELQADAGFDGKKTEKEGSRDRKALNTQNSEPMGEKMLSIGLNTWFSAKARAIVPLKREYMVVIVRHNT